jgi:hypothetical protein
MSKEDLRNKDSESTGGKEAGAVRARVQRSVSSSNLLQTRRKDDVSNKIDELFKTPVERVATGGFFAGIAARFALGEYNEVSTSNSDYDADLTDESADDGDDAYMSPSVGRVNKQEYV